MSTGTRQFSTATDAGWSRGGRDRGDDQNGDLEGEEDENLLLSKLSIQN